MIDKFPSKSDKANHPKVSTGEQQRSGLYNSPVAPRQPFSRRLHRKQTAEYLGVSLSWLDKSRLSGLGPTFIALGGRVVYDTADLEDFMQKNRHTSTSG